MKSRSSVRLSITGQFYPYNLRKILHVLFRDMTAGDIPDFRGLEIFHYVREFLGVRPTAKMVFDF